MDLLTVSVLAILRCGTNCHWILVFVNLGSVLSDIILRCSISFLATEGHFQQRCSLFLQKWCSILCLIDSFLDHMDTLS